MLWKGRIECDGLIPDQYAYLFDTRAYTSIQFPDTVVFERGWPKVWFAWETGEPGTAPVLRRRMGKDVHEERLIHRFTSDMDGYPIDPASIVGEYTSYDGANGFTVEYMDCDGIAKFIAARSAGMTGVLQRFVKSKSPSNTVIQAVWSTSSTFLSARQSQVTFKTKNATIAERCCTFDGPPQLSQPSIASPYLRQRIDKQLVELSALVLATESVRVKGIVAYFKVNRQGRLVLLRCTSIRTRPEPGMGGVLRKPVNILATMRSPPVLISDIGSDALPRVGAFTDVDAVDSVVDAADEKFKQLLEHAAFMGNGKSIAQARLERELQQSGVWVMQSSAVQVLHKSHPGSPVMVGRAVTKWSSPEQGSVRGSPRAGIKDADWGADALEGFDDVDVSPDEAVTEDVQCHRLFPRPPPRDRDDQARLEAAQAAQCVSADPADVPADPLQPHRAALFDDMCDASYAAVAFRADVRTARAGMGLSGLANDVTPAVPWSETGRYKFVLRRSMWQIMASGTRMATLKRVFGLRSEYAFDQESGRRVEVLCFTAPRYRTEREVLEGVLDVFPPAMGHSVNAVPHSASAPTFGTFPSSARSLFATSGTRRPSAGHETDGGLSGSDGCLSRATSAAVSRRGSLMQGGALDGDGAVDNELALLQTVQRQQSKAKRNKGGWRRAFGPGPLERRGSNGASFAFTRGRRRSTTGSDAGDGTKGDQTSVAAIRAALEESVYDTSSGDDDSVSHGVNSFLSKRYNTASTTSSSAQHGPDAKANAAGQRDATSPKQSFTVPKLRRPTIHFVDSADNTPRGDATETGSSPRGEAEHPGSEHAVASVAPFAPRERKKPAPPRKPEPVDWHIDSAFPKKPKPPSKQGKALSDATTKACVTRMLTTSVSERANLSLSGRTRALSKSQPIFASSLQAAKGPSTARPPSQLPPQPQGKKQEATPISISMARWLA